MLKTRGSSFDGQRVVVSGSGNVAINAIAKAQTLGASVVACPDSSGYIVDEAGIDVALLRKIKEVERGRLKEYSLRRPGVAYVDAGSVWDVDAKVALPCATQNEISGEDAKTLLDNGCVLVSEAANMPTAPAGVDLFLARKILYGPGKAANAGGVATSGLEMSQNSMRLPWPRQEVDSRLRQIMATIHKNAWETAAEYGQPGNLVIGANIAGFVKVADAMLDQGVV
jgi:glutamate dehydrogenase (NADP+)